MKLLFGLIIGITVLVILVALYCALMIAGRTDDCDDRFCKEHICSKCKTGKDSYDLDPKSEACPYIECLKGNKCQFYAPFNRTPKKKLFK